MADGWSGDRTAKSHKTNGTDDVKKRRKPLKNKGFPLLFYAKMKSDGERSCP